MNSVCIDLGFINIYWYSVIIFFAIIIGGFFALKEAKRWEIPEDFMINLFFYMIPIAIIGARLYYVVFNWGYYSNNIIDIFKIWEGGLAIHGAILFGLIWAIIYSKKYKVTVFRLTDILVVGVLIAQAIGRWGNFFNGEAHGPATTLANLQSQLLPNFIIDGMYINGTYYIPTFLYESLWCLLGFIIFLFIRRLKYLKIGQLTGLYFIWYGIGRLIIEGLRTDSLMLGTLKMAQIVSVGMIIIGVIIVLIKLRGSRFDNQYNDYHNIEFVNF